MTDRGRLLRERTDQLGVSLLESSSVETRTLNLVENEDEITAPYRPDALLSDELIEDCFSLIGEFFSGLLHISAFTEEFNGIDNLLIVSSRDALRDDSRILLAKFAQMRIPTVATAPALKSAALFRSFTTGEYPLCTFLQRFVSLLVELEEVDVS